MRLYVKVEFFNPAGSVKDRLAASIIEEAERRGELRLGQTVVEATSGNTGIGLAMVCAAKGYRLVVIISESFLFLFTFSVECRRLMRFLGAKVVLTPRAAKGLGMYQMAEELAQANGWISPVSSRHRTTLRFTRTLLRASCWQTLRTSAWTYGSAGTSQAER